MLERYPDHHRRERAQMLDRLLADRALAVDVYDRLADAPDIDASEVEVSVHEGAVTLEGSVGERYEKQRAEDLTGHIAGVREVHNHLDIRPM